MADPSANAPAVQSTFPAPPQYYLRYAADGKGGLPLPPPKPIEGEYTMFDVKYNTETPLQEHPDNAKRDLSELTRELSTAFRQLVNELATQPATSHAKTEQVESILKQIHESINARRPQQAREMLLSLVEAQAASRSELAADIRGRVSEIRGTLQSLAASLRTSLNTPSPFFPWLDQQGTPLATGAAVTPGNDISSMPNTPAGTLPLSTSATSAHTTSSVPPPPGPVPVVRPDSNIAMIHAALSLPEPPSV